MIEYVGARAPARGHPGERATALAFVQRLDTVLLAAVAALVGYGLWVIAGVTRYDVEGAPDYYVTRQGVAAALGVVGMVAMILIDPQFLRRQKRLLYAGTVAVMLLVFAAGEAARGSRRWIDVGFFQFQPSEFGKVFFVLALAAFLADRGKRVRSIGTVAAAVALALGPVLLVFYQPDIGTALVYIAAAAAVLFLAGTRWLHLAALAALGVSVVVGVLWAAPAAGIHILKP